MEESLFRATNAARSEQGLAPLQWDELLARAARSHADLMLQRGQLSHVLPGEASLSPRAAQAGVHFQTIAENIGQGPSVDSIQHSWMNSPPHRANILDPNLNHVGFAVVGHGSSFYAVADFSQALAALSFDEIEAQVGKVLISRGLQTGGSVEEARKTCEMDEGSAAASKPLFIMRWQSTDLTRLPDVLEERIQTHRYHTAVVGACASARTESGFATYRVAVLLY
jgi:Cysteine-rich secretory protein family